MSAVANAAAAIHHCNLGMSFWPLVSVLTSTVNGSSQNGAMAMLATTGASARCRTQSLPSAVGGPACATLLSSTIDLVSDLLSVGWRVGVRSISARLVSCAEDSLHLRPDRCTWETCERRWWRG